MKLVIYVVNPEDFLQEQYGYSLSATTRDLWDWWNEDGENRHNYTFLAEVDVDMDVDRADMTNTAVAALDKREEKIRAEAQNEITKLEKRKAELLAIPFISGDSNVS